MRLPAARSVLTAGLAAAFGTLGLVLAAALAIALGAALWWAFGLPF